MPQIYHTVPCYGYRGVPFVMQLLVEEEGNPHLSVFVEYGKEGGSERLRLLPTDAYQSEEYFTLYSVHIPPEHLTGVCFSYRFCVDEIYTNIYTFPLKNVEIPLPADQDALFPAVLPLWEGEDPYLAADAPLMRFVSFPPSLARLSVCARIGGVWEQFPTQLNDLGVWECLLPTNLPAKAGKRLFYYVQASGYVYETCLGSEREPLSIRLVDDAGPEILHISPAEGEELGEQPHVLHVEYRDASGVDLSASDLFLDGRNVGEKAEWTANGVTFHLQTPLDGGEHRMEISLRDTHGNRTYRRVVFFVKGTDGAQAPSSKKSISTVRAAGFFGSALATIKKLFSDKD